jgi:hypothetical protein
MRAAISEFASRSQFATDSAVIAASVSRTGVSEGAEAMMVPFGWGRAHSVVRARRARITPTG